MSREVAVIHYNPGDAIPANLRRVAAVRHANIPPDRLALTATAYAFGDTIPPDRDLVAGVSYDPGDTIPAHLQQVAGVGITYLLRDSFLTDLAAGAVHNTAAEPGPGTRLVTDVESKITISDGKLRFAGGMAAPSLSDPVVNYLFPHVVGQMAFAKFLPGSKATHFGVDGDTSGRPQAGILHNLGTLLIDWNATATLNVSGYAILDECVCCVVLRSNGAFLFHKGAGYQNWELVGISYTTMSGNVYLRMHDYDTDYEVPLWEIAVPTAVWLPVPFASDSFDRDDGAIGSTDGLAHVEANGGDARLWTSQAGTWEVITNKAGVSALAGGLGLATVESDSRDFYGSVELDVAAGRAGILMRYVDADNYLYAYHDGTNLGCIRRIAGTETAISTAAARTYAAGARLEVALRGLSIGVLYNGANGLLNLANDDVGANLLASNKHGLYTSDLGNRFNNVQIWKKGTRGEYNHLSRYLDTPGLGFIMWLWDDGNDTDYSIAYPYLKQYGWVGSSAISTDLINGTYLSVAHMDQMHADGWDFCNHSRDHFGNGLTDDEIKERLTTATTQLNTWGYTRASNIVRTPGTFTDRTDAQKAALVLATGLVGQAPTVMQAPKTLSQGTPAIAIDYASGGVSLSNVCERIRSGILKGEAVCLYGHNMGVNPTPAIFREVADWVYQQGYPCGTISQWLAKCR